MNERARELVLGVGLLAAAVMGIGIDALAGTVDPPPPLEPAGDFVERAVFCPPRSFGDEAWSQVAIAPRSDAGATVGIEPVMERVVDIPGGGALFQALKVRKAVTVVGYGATVGVAAIESVDSAVGSGQPVAGVGAAGCPAQASTTWYFPQGSSSIQSEGRLVIANPFPDEAVVRVRFLTPGGEVTSANLAEVPVPAGRATVLRVNQFVQAQNLLSAEVSAVRGRVVAWSGLLTRRNDAQHGFELTAGAPAPSGTWYFPEGETGPGFDQRFVVMNPNQEEARVTVSLLTSERVIQPRRLVEVSVAAESSRSIVLDDSAAREIEQIGGGGVSAVVQSTNSVDVVVERTIYYDTDELGGVSTEIGAPRPARRWLLGPAVGKPDADVLVLMNPSSDDARVDLSFLKEGGPAVRPEEVQDLVVPAGLRLKVPIRDFTGNIPKVLLVSADMPVVAERYGYSAGRNDVATLIGLGF